MQTKRHAEKYPTETEDWLSIPTPQEDDNIISGRGPISILAARPLKSQKKKPTAWMCESWCSTNKNNWGKKCKWDTGSCGGCRRCKEFWTCDSWCDSSDEPWKIKCKWDECSGCSTGCNAPSFEGPKGFVAPPPTAANMLPGLLPPEGTMWRGATHWVVPMASNYNPFEFKDEFDVPLHIYRTFKHGGNYPLTKAELAHISSGGILWYGFQPLDWKGAATGKLDSLLHTYADTVASVAPAQVMVCPGWEPDGHAAPLAHGRELFGETADYITFYERTVKIFKEQGATNAVFIVDFSAKGQFDEGTRNLIPDLIPDGGIVKWVFWNMFQVRDDYTWNRAAKKGRNPPHWDSKVHLEFWDTFFRTDERLKYKIKDIPWGIGAWGTTYETGVFPPTKTKVEDRILFIDQVAEAFNAKTYPNLKASIYFDSLSSIITPLQVEITQVGDIANHNAIIKYENSHEIVPSFRNYLHATPFTKNDHMIKVPDGIQFSKQWDAAELDKWISATVHLSAKQSNLEAGIKFVEARFKEAAQRGYLDNGICEDARADLMDAFEAENPTWCVKAELVKYVTILKTELGESYWMETQKVLGDEDPH